MTSSQKDIKLAASGEVVLLDFGLSKGSVGEQSQVTTGTSLLGFTPRYAPLEQIRGTGTTPRSDLYALAATLHHLLTGQLPVSALDRADAVLNHESDPQPPAHELNPQVPVAVSTLLLQAMSLNMAERPASGAVMRAALQAAIDESSIDESSQTTVFVLPGLRRSQMANAVLHGAQILWVDDNPHNNVELCRILKPFGATVDIARSTNEALAMIEEKSYDLIISDIARDGVRDEGLAFLRILQNRGSHPKIIFYTGKVDHEKPTPQGAFGITILCTGINERVSRNVILNGAKRK